MINLTVDTDNFILSSNGGTHCIQVFSAPTYLLRVTNEGQLSLTDGSGDIVTSPPRTTTGIMLYIEVLKLTSYNNMCTITLRIIIFPCRLKVALNTT